MLISQSFRDLQTEIGADKAAQAMKKKMAQLRKESTTSPTNEGLGYEIPSRDLSDAMLEIFSWSNDIMNWEDVTEVFRKRLRWSV